YMTLTTLRIYRPEREENEERAIEANKFDSLSDSDIWEKYKKGNEEAFIYIYSKYVNTLYNFGCHHCKDHDLVKDCIQDLFISLKRKKGFTSVSSIKPYLFKSLRRDLFRVLEKRQKYSLKDDIEFFQQFDISLSWDQKMMEDQFIEERKQTLLKSINELTDKQKEAVLYYFYEGFSYDEISDIMDMSSPKSARKLIYRAIDGLRLALKKREPSLLFF
ncbi:MAG: sigma-70 family RNA polymerase sigma factor, partial [Cyclobacteriaceae bacterium]|nr:sigma-70 family RNA polymerase sigma factor [Cyclobacteriaceae bacterium]